MKLSDLKDKDKENIKRDIVRFYLTGKIQIQAIMLHYKIKERHIITKLLNEVISELNQKSNSLF